MCRHGISRQSDLCQIYGIFRESVISVVMFMGARVPDVENNSVLINFKHQELGQGRRCGMGVILLHFSAAEAFQTVFFKILKSERSQAASISPTTPVVLLSTSIRSITPISELERTANK